MADTPRMRPDPELERLKITHAIEVEDKKLADDQKKNGQESRLIFWSNVV